MDKITDFYLSNGSFIRFAFCDSYFRNVRGNAVGIHSAKCDNLGKRHEMRRLLRIISKNKPRGKCYDRMLRLSLKH